MPNETWQSDFTHYRLTRPDGRPGADVEIISWLDDCTRYALHVTAHPRITTPIVLDHVPRNRLPSTGSRRPRSPTTAWSTPPGSPARTPAAATLRGRAAPPPHRPEELPTRPPHHLRQGRAVPADDEEVAARPTRPAHHDRRTPGTPRRLRRRVQPPPAAPLPAPPGDPGHRSTTRCPRRPRPGHRPPTPTTGSATTRSTRPARSPCATTADAPHRHRPNPRRNPRHPARPRPPDPDHRRRNRRTPPRTDPRPHPRLPGHRTPKAPPDDPRKDEPGPQSRFGCRRCLETSHCSGGRI